jgi:hypothetical protein
MFSRTWTSVDPLALIRICQKLVALPGLVSVLTVASIPPAKFPITGDQGGFVTPEGGVASAMPPYTATPARPRTRVKSQFGFTVLLS